MAALQTALHKNGLYDGTIDGLVGAATRAAVRRLQRRAGLRVDGVAGPKTRRALGRYGRPPLGSRVLTVGALGWDVAALQFSLAWHGFPSGTFDGHLGTRTDSAVRRFQEWSRLPVDGRVGPATLAALRGPRPVCAGVFGWPVLGMLTSPFGPRGSRFHAGIDIGAVAGTPVLAAAAGRVAYAGWRDGGWGRLVVVAHSRGIRTFYAHLSRVLVQVGDGVAAGTQVGRVGSSGRSRGPHLHLEMRVRGAACDPLTALP